MMPKISVLLPVYKTNPEYLKEAIQSILDQTFKDFELLVIDDCPTESREEVVNSFHDPRIRYTQNAQNMGITPTRNKLIAMAQGEYLAVMDHDDISLPTRFEEQVKVLDAHPEIGVVGTLYKRFPHSKGISKLPETNQGIEAYLMEGCAVLHPSSMIRASVLDQNNIRYEEEFTPAEDYALWCRLIGKTQFYNIQKILFHYRWHETNTSKLQDDKRLAAVEKIHAFLARDQQKLYQKVQQEAIHIVRGKLFGLVPVLRMKIKGTTIPGWIHLIPCLKIKVKQVVSS